MFELSKSPKYQLPVIPFDVEPLKLKLQEALSKYDGLTFSDNDIKELKATIAELNKSEKMVDDYRKKVKKAVSAPIEEFEKKMNDLKILVVQTRNEFKVTYDKFEEDRKTERKTEIDKLILQIIEDSDLFAPFDSQVPFKKEYLNKGMTLDKIELDVLQEVERLSQTQAIKQAKLQRIEDKCKILSYELKLKTDIQTTAYIALLEYQDVDVILDKIEMAANAQLERENYVAPVKVVERIVEPELITIDVPVPETLPEVMYEVWEVEGTEYQLEQIEDFMVGIGVNWEIVEEDYK